MKYSPLFLIPMLSASLALSMPASAQDSGADNHGVVHTATGQVIRSSSGNCVRTKWASKGDECYVAPKVAEAYKPVPYYPVPYYIDDDERTIYFESNQYRLFDSEKRKLDTLARTYISQVNIVGYADRMGSDRYNEQLSERRARVVEAYLRERGYLNTGAVRTRWLGESYSVTSCANNLTRKALVACLQADRRVTVEVRY